MNKIKLFSLIVFACCFYQKSIAQPFIELKGGYTSGVAEQNLTLNTAVTRTTGLVHTFYNPFYTETLAKKVNYGSGFNLGLTFGNWFSPYIGASIGVGYFNGTVLNNYKFTNKTNTVEKVYTTNITNTQLRLLPSILLATGSQKSLKPYLRLSAVLPVLNYSEEKYALSDVTTQVLAVYGLSKTTVEANHNKRIDYNFTVGFASAIGVNWQISKNIGLVAELDFTALNSKTQKARITDFNYSYNFQPASGAQESEKADINKLSVYAKEINYKDVIDENSNVQTDIPFKIADENKPKDELAYANNSSAIGLNIGLRYHFVATQKKD